MDIGLHEEETLFARAIGLSRADREGFLRSACGGDGALWQRMARLIEAHEAGDNIVDDPCDEAEAIKMALHRIIRPRSEEDE